MARIAGVNIPVNKRAEVALTYIYGVGRNAAIQVLKKAKVDPNVRIRDLTQDEMAKIRETIDSDLPVEGDLRREVALNIKRLMDLNAYRGMRHRKGLPVRGQRTHTNARSRKGPRRPVSGKKS